MTNVAPRLRRLAAFAFRHLFRHALQLAATGFLIWTAGLALWRNNRLAHNSERLVALKDGELAGFAYGRVEALLGLIGDPLEVSEEWLGMPWAATVAGFDTADPILVMGHALQTGTIDVRLWAMAALPLLLAVLLGRVFCSHLCPMRLLFEIGQAVRRGLLRVGLSLPNYQPRPRLGGWLLLGGFGASALGGFGVWLLLLPYVALGASIHLAIVTGVTSTLVLVVVFWVVLDVLFSPGLFCRDVCPTGFLLGQLGRFRLWRLNKVSPQGNKVSRQTPCPTGCNLCSEACPYSLTPQHEETMAQWRATDCDNCGICAAVCPQDRLTRSLGLPTLRRRLPIIPTTLLILVGLGVTGPAFAHHNKGLPHYGYYENYPQVPTEEHVVIAGDWEIGATIFNFQGLEREQADTPNDVKIYLYLYNLADDRAYVGPVDFAIWLDGEVVARFERSGVDDDSTYSTRETLPTSGQYELIATIKGPVGSAERPDQLRLPFSIDLSDGLNIWLLVMLILPLALALALALAGRDRLALRQQQGRRRRAAAAPSSTFLALMLLSQLGLTTAAWPAIATEATTDRDEVRDEVPVAPLPSRHHACGAGMAMTDLRTIPTTHADDHPGMKHFSTDDGRLVMVMVGIPKSLLLLGVALLLLLSFVVVEVFGSKKKQGFRFDLTKKKRYRRWFKARWPQRLAQLTTVAVLLVLTAIGLFGSRVQNLTPVAVWTIWWAALVFVIALAGPVFCWACPWDGLSNLVTRFRGYFVTSKTLESLSLRLPWPKALANLYPAIALFSVLTWLELGFGVTTNPRTTALMGLGMGLLAVTTALLFDQKRFCAHLCPVGRISSIYANFSPVEVRARNLNTCAQCTTEDCLQGNDRGYACPTGLSLKVLNEATHCSFCLECVRSCPYDNAAVRLRPPAQDLDVARKGRLDEAWLSLALLALTLFHGLSMTPAWENFAPGSMSLLKWLQTTLALPKVAAFTLGMLASVSVPIILYALSCALGARLSHRRHSTRTLFIQYSYALLPIALFYHLAHNAMHLLMEGQHIVPLLSDPLGRGHDFFGTASLKLAPLLDGTTIGVVQVVLILIGHLVGIVVAHRIAQRLFAGDKASATRSLIPMLAVMILISVAGLGLMALDMNMRSGRM